MISWIPSPRPTDSSVGVVLRLVVGVGVQRIGVVIGGDQRLQRGADVVEGDFLRVQAAAAGLRMELELLRAPLAP